MLSPYRELDLTNERGLICGRIPASRGDSVVAAEPVIQSSEAREARHA